MASTIVVANPDPKFRSRVIELLGRPAALQEADRIGKAEAILRELDGEAGVLVIGPGIATEDALHVAAEAQLYSPAVEVVLVAPRLTASLLQAAMRAGVRDVLPASFTGKQLREAVERASSFARPAGVRPGSPEPTHGKIIMVFSSKGGCGKSVISSNLALMIAEQSGSEVALVDLDLEAGDLAIMLQLTPERTIHDAAANISRLDADALRQYLTPYRSGMALLAAPTAPGLAEKISGDTVRQIFSILREAYAHVVVDGPSYFTEQALSALDEADEVLLVASLDVPSIKNLKLALRTLALLNFPRDRIRIVLNRADSKVGLSVSEVENALGTSIDVLVPSSRDVPLCVNRGVPVAVDAPKSSVAIALGRLAESVRTTQAASKSAPRRWFSRR